MLSSHNGTTIRGHKGTTHTAAHSRHCSLCAVLGSGEDNPTFTRRHQRVVGEEWRVRATFGVGASEPALPRSLRCDLGLCCCVMSYYSVLTLSTNVAIPQRCCRSRNRHPSRTTAAAATAAAAIAVRRLFAATAVGVSCVCFKECRYKKTGCSVVVVMIVVIERGRAAVPQLFWRVHRHRHLRPRPRIHRCCCCCGSGCGAATAVCLTVLCWACPCQ